MDKTLVQGAESISLFCRLMVNEKKELPIRSSEMGLLILAEKSSVPLTPVKAAAYFHVSKPMVAAMVRSLRLKGYLTKIPSPVDKRSVILKATAAGHELVESTYAEYYKTMKTLKANLGARKFQTLVDILAQANEILWEEKNNG